LSSSPALSLSLSSSSPALSSLSSLSLSSSSIAESSLSSSAWRWPVKDAAPLPPPQDVAKSTNKVAKSVNNNARFM
jgi:hypothetical protein